MTRTEALIAKGYDAETIAGHNGHVEVSDPEPQIRNAVSDLPASASAHCSECNAPFEPIRRGNTVQMTCGPECSAARTARRNRVEQQARRQVPAKQYVLPTVPGPVPAPPDLLSHLEVVAGALPVGWSVQLANDGAVLRWAPHA